MGRVKTPIGEVEIVKRSGKLYCGTCGGRVNPSASNHYCNRDNPKPIPEEGETRVDDDSPDTDVVGEDDGDADSGSPPESGSTSPSPQSNASSESEIDVDAALDAVYGEQIEEEEEKKEAEADTRRKASRKAKSKRKVLLTDVMPKGGKVVWHYVHRAEGRVIDWVAGTKGTDESVLKELDGDVGETLDELANAAFPLHIDVKVAYLMMQVAVFGGHLAMHLDSFAGRVSSWMARREEKRLARKKVQAELKKLEQEEPKE